MTATQCTAMYLTKLREISEVWCQAKVPWERVKVIPLAQKVGFPLGELRFGIRRMEHLGYACSQKCLCKFH